MSPSDRIYLRGQLQELETGDDNIRKWKYVLGLNKVAGKFGTVAIEIMKLPKITFFNIELQAQFGHAQIIKIY